MYISSKKYTKLGRKRFGSAIFIDDLEEQRIDKITGIERDPSIFITLIILIATKILSANILGILLTIPLFFLIYFWGNKVVTINFTTHRLLIEREFANPRIIKFFAYFLFGISAFIIFRYFNSDIDNLEFRVQMMAQVFIFFYSYNTNFFNYRNLVQDNFTIFNNFDIIITLCVSLWFGYQFLKISYNFTEINTRHVSEQLIRIRELQEFRYLLIYLFFFLIIHYVVFTRFSILFVIISVIIYQSIPKHKYLFISLVGPSNRIFIRNFAVDITELSNLARTTAITFGWTTQKDQITREFPQNIIPREVVSSYTTGLQAYSKQAYRQGNLIGLAISILTSLFVILAVIRYALRSEIDYTFEILYNIFLLTLITVTMFISVYLLNRLRISRQQKENLLIGDGFISRFVKNSLWILKGSSMEGTTIQRNRSRALVRFDKARGMIIEWERFTILIISSLIVIVLGIWNSLGGINLEVLPRLLPSLITSGTEFLEQKAQTELEFYIYGGLLFWLFIVFYYPRYYSRSRPTLFIDMEYASIEPVLLKDFNEHQDASVQFTKSLISAAISDKKQKIRPGTFVLSVIAKLELKETVGGLRFYAGENLIVKEINDPVYEEIEIFRNLFVSALKGFPELEIIVEVFGKKNLVVFTQLVKFSIYYDYSEVKNIDLGNYGHVELSVEIKKQKA